MFGCDPGSSPADMAHDPYMRDLMGYLPGSTAHDDNGPTYIEENVDPIPFQDDGYGPGQGLVLDRHVHYIYRDDPDLWEMVERFKSGEFNCGEGWAFNTEHLRSYSCFQLEIVDTIIAVLHRRRNRKRDSISKKGQNNDT